MTLLDIFFIGIGLSMDAFAVSMSQGLMERTPNHRRAFLVACFFGGFQALMPLLGFTLGSLVSSYLKIGNWIASALLAFLGLKMILEEMSPDNDSAKGDPAGIRKLFVLATATSIDAMAAGITFSLQDTIVWSTGGINIFFACALIGCTTFILSYFGFLIGRSFGLRFKRPASIAGGVILILIGVKILIESFMK